MIRVHSNTKTHPQNALFAGRQGGEDFGGGVLQVGMDSGIQRNDGVFILNEIPKRAVFFIPHGRFQTDGLFGDFHDLADFIQRHLQLNGQFLGCGFAANFMHHLARCAHNFIDGFDHMNRDPNGSGLIGDGSCDGLTNPPCGIGGKFVASAVFKFIHGLHQANVTFLDQIQKLQSSVRIFFGNGDDKAQVGLDHFFFGAVGFPLAPLNGLDNAAKFRNGQPALGGNFGNHLACCGDFITVFFNKHLPRLGFSIRHAIHPRGIQLGAKIALQKITALDFAFFSQTQQLPFLLHQGFVHTIQLFHQLFQTFVIQMDAFQQRDDFFMFGVIGLFFRWLQRVAFL